MSTAEEAYRESATRHMRDELIMSHLGLVRQVMGRLMETLPSHVDPDMLESAGMVGLLQAADKYEPSRGEFAPFARHRIRGAMIDDIRKDSAFSQATMQSIKKVEEARLRCKAPASIADLAAEADLSEQQVIHALDAARWTRVGEGLPMDDLWEARRSRQADGSDPSQKAAEDEMLQALTAAIVTLDERERVVVTMYYLEGLTLDEIGEVLEIKNKGGVSRLLAKARHQLREKMRAAFGSDMVGAESRDPDT